MPGAVDTAANLIDVSGRTADGSGQPLGIDREIGVLQQLSGDGGLVGIIVVHDVHSVFSFRF